MIAINEYILNRNNKIIKDKDIFNKMNIDMKFYEIKDILIHFEHLINIGGEDIAAIGTDFDGMSCELAIKSAGEMPILVDALIDKFGYNLAEKICYKNALRILN